MRPRVCGGAGVLHIGSSFTWTRMFFTVTSVTHHALGLGDGSGAELKDRWGAPGAGALGAGSCFHEVFFPVLLVCHWTARALP